ncbi:MAG: hypothetical protein AAB932_01175, partial [Patescibacteria group bacterium]
MASERQSPEHSYTVRHVDAHGPDWVYRREEKRDQQAGSLAIWGYDALQKSKLLEGKSLPGLSGGNLDNLPLGIKNNLRKYAEKGLNTQIPKLHENIANAARENPELIDNILKNFLIDSADIENEIKNLGLSHLYDDESDDETTYLIAAHGGDKKKFLADEVAQIITDMYLNEKQAQIIPTSQLMRIVEHHAENSLKRREEMLKDIELAKEACLELVHKAIENGLLPIDAKIAKERLETLSVEVFDEMIGTLGEKWGDFVFQTHQIRISLQIPKDKIRHVVLHEILHALSGQHEREETLHGDDDPLVDYEQTRIGLRFNPSARESRTRPKKRQPTLRWLNEAVTEQTTMDMLEITKSWSYSSERRLLSLLVDAGITVEALRSAYFESYTTGQRTPLLKALFDTTNAAFGT